MPKPISKLYHIFLGPSVYSLHIDLSIHKNIIIHPPIKRGDITLMANKYPIGNAVIVDGNFHESLSVGHVEIRKAIQKGWVVYGLSSMGAIRASEMSQLGMIGYGKVYKLFSIFEDFSDDEVALLHTSEEPYFPISEPLVNLRFYLKYLKRHNIISRDNYFDTIFKLKETYFGDRTIKLCNSLLEKNEPNCLEGIDLNFNDFRVKNQDFLSFVQWITKSTSDNINE